MLSTIQRRILIASGMVMVAIATKPEIMSKVAFLDWELPWQAINIIGPVTMPMAAVLAMALYHSLQIALTSSKEKIGVHVARVNFHTSSALILGTLGTFIGVATSPELNELALSQAMTSTIVGMGARFAFRYVIDFLTRGKYSLDGVQHD